MEFHHLLSVSLDSGSLWTVQTSPASLDNGSDSAAMSVIRRHETLSATKRELQRRLGRLEAEVEQSQGSLQSLKQEHGIKILVRVARVLGRAVFSITNAQSVGPIVRSCVLQMGIKQLSELQSQLQKLKEENKNAEVKLLMEQGSSREKVASEI